MNISPLEFDLAHWKTLNAFQGYCLLAASDEVGRGPLAGPVVSSTVLLLTPLNWTPKKVRDFLEELGRLGINDSKKISPKKRKQILGNLGIEFSSLPPLFAHIKTKFCDEGMIFAYSLDLKDHQEIDRLNILQASLQCMANSFQHVFGEASASKDFPKNIRGKWLVDGNKTPPLKLQGLDIHPVIKGDSRSLLIALSSIIAKEFRDSLMEQMDKRYPQYGFAKNFGYPTQLHREAIKTFGPSPIHRLTFGGVKEFAEVGAKKSL